MSLFHHWPFDNSFVRELKADPILQNYPRQVPMAHYSHVLPQPVSNPRLLAYSQAMFAPLDLKMTHVHSHEFLQIVSGNRLLDGMQPIAHNYGGHQFGHWAGQLGDGRAILLGEIVNRHHQRWQLQLKGAGPTPYARRGDGYAVLRSSLREFICSEAMHHLGIPTTRALSLVTTGESVLRDMFYDGHSAFEPGAVVCRAAPSFLRFGHFEIFAARTEMAALQQLTDYALRYHFPELPLGPAGYEALFNTVCQRTADLMIHWNRVGFVHGVMNTDNMSLLGLTIDYGPFGWLEEFDPNWTPNTTDAAQHRYAYGRQGEIALWNLSRLAYALSMLIDETTPFEDALDGYISRYQQGLSQMHRQKLGIVEQHDLDDALSSDLHQLMQSSQADMTLLYRRLADLRLSAHDDALDHKLLQSACYQILEPSQWNRWQHWLARYRSRLQQQNETDDLRKIRMNRINPLFLPRNYLLQQAAEQIEQGDTTHLNNLRQLIQDPYQENDSLAHYCELRPEWARNKAGCSMLSCSS